jgi:hypothetical protein
MHIDRVARFNIIQKPDGVELETDFCGAITREFYNVRAMATEKAIRDKLIELGWTPPPTEGEA